MDTPPVRERGAGNRLLVEVAEDEDFKQVVASAPAIVSAAADWTCRVLVGNLKPATRLLVSIHRRDGT